MVWDPGKLATPLWDLFLRESSPNVAKGSGATGKTYMPMPTRGEGGGALAKGAPPNFLILVITLYEQ